MRTTMPRSIKSTSSYLLRRGYATESAPERKVAVLGAAGGIQPLALLVKLNPFVSKLSLYDFACTPCVAANVSHIDTRSEVDVPRKPGMTRDDLFNINVGIVKCICTAIVKYCSHAIVND